MSFFATKLTHFKQSLYFDKTKIEELNNSFLLDEVLLLRHAIKINPPFSCPCFDRVTLINDNESNFLMKQTIINFHFIEEVISNHFFCATIYKMR